MRPLYRLIVTGPEPTALEQVGQAVPELVAGAAGGLVGYALGGPAGAATGGALTPAMVTAWNVGGLALVHRLSRGSRALDVAADELDVGLDILTERATADEPRLELLARVLEAAGRTSLDEKIPALGRVLAGALQEDGDVDEAIVLAGALDDLEAPHVEVLAHVAVAGEVGGDRPGVDMADLGERFPHRVAVLYALLPALELHGLLEDAGATSYGGGHRWHATPLGQRCLDLLAPRSGA